MKLNLEVTGYANGLYHKDIYLPQDIIDRLPSHIQNIRYTNHALGIAIERTIVLPKEIFGGTVFEVEIMGGMIVKFGITIRKFKHTNLSMIFFPYPTFVVCGTAWLNDCKSKQTNLNHSRYVHRSGYGQATRD